MLLYALYAAYLYVCMMYIVQLYTFEYTQYWFDLLTEKIWFFKRRAGTIVNRFDSLQIYVTLNSRHLVWKRCVVLKAQHFKFNHKTHFFFSQSLFKC